MVKVAGGNGHYTLVVEDGDKEYRYDYEDIRDAFQDLQYEVHPCRLLDPRGVQMPYLAAKGLAELAEEADRHTRGRRSVRIHRDALSYRLVG